ncbi:MAG: hypothetical protein KAU31_07660, partial [Spirochaetaceae bacterium]|nr:hypothetical protein [Spirochaetaceae bacterium]
MLRRITAVPVLAVIAVVFIATSVQAQIAVEPRTTASVEIPDFFGDTDLFWSGGTVGVGARLSAHQTSPIGLNLDLLCTTLALRGGDWFDVNMIRPEVGLDLRHHLFSWLAVQFRVAGGFGVAWTPTTRLPYSDNAAWGPSVRAGAAVVFRPGRLMLSAGVDYNSFIGLCRLLALSLSGGWAMGRGAPTTDREADRQTEPE